MKKNNKKISSSDLKLWSQILDKVEPIKKSGRSIIQNQSKSIIDEYDRDSGDVTEQNTKIKKVRQSHVIDEKIPRKIHNNNHDKKTEFTGIHRRLEQKMSRGQIEIDSTLDLHGMTQEEAQQAIIRFIEQQLAATKQYLLIIHGKGKNSPATQPATLKNLTNHLLRQLDPVLAFCSAQVHDGGTGALYVLLRSARNPHA